MSIGSINRVLNLSSSQCPANNASTHAGTVGWAERIRASSPCSAHTPRFFTVALPPRATIGPADPLLRHRATASGENALELVALRRSQFQKRNIEAWRNFMPSTVRQSGNGLQVRDKERLEFLYTGDQVVRDDDERMYSMMIMAEQIMYCNLWVAMSLSISIL